MSKEMSKITEMLKQENLRLQNEEIESQIEKNKTDIEKNKFDMETKDRVNISLKEYEKLKRELENTKEAKERYENILNKILKPIYDASGKEDIYIERIMNGDFKARVYFTEDAMILRKIVSVAYEIYQ